MRTIPDNIPQAFWDKYKAMLPDEEFSDFQQSCLHGLRKSIRVNTIKISVEDFLEKAKIEEWELQPIPWCKTGFWIDRDDHSIPLGKHYLHLSGHFYIQEASSMLPPEFLGLEYGETVLDVAAAPGSKTTQMAALLQNTGLIVANEPEIPRIKAMASNLERLGVANVLFTNKDGRAFSNYFPNFFDKILLDAPCGGEGTIRKDKHALDFWNEKRVGVFSKLQMDLAIHAFLALKPGGEMIYSTCTLSPEENEDIVEGLLAMFADNAELIPLHIDSEVDDNNSMLPGTLRIWPHLFNSEGFFVAKIKKNLETEIGDFIDARRDSPFHAMSRSTFAWMNKQLQEWFGFKMQNSEMIFERGNEIWLRPINFETVAQKIVIERGGMLLATRHRNDLKMTHQGALYLIESGLIPTKGVVKLDSEESKVFFRGLDIPKITDEKQLVYLQHQGTFIGIGKSLGKKIKNQLPRHFTVS